MSRRPLGLIIWLCAGPILQSRLLKLSNSTHNCPACYSPNTAEVLPSSYDYPLILKQMHPVYTVLPLNPFPFGRTIQTFFLITLVVRSPPSVCKGRGQSIINQQCRQDVGKMWARWAISLSWMNTTDPTMRARLAKKLLHVNILPSLY